jgi:hypothetical protein
MVGPAEDGFALAGYADALAPSTVTVCRLHAGRDQLTSRIMLRGQGRGNWSQPGDPLLGRPVPYLRQVADRAAHEAETLEQAGIGHRIDTDGQAVEDIVDAVVARIGWPDRQRQGLHSPVRSGISGDLIWPRTP